MTFELRTEGGDRLLLEDGSQILLELQPVEVAASFPVTQGVATGREVLRASGVVAVVTQATGTGHASVRADASALAAVTTAAATGREVERSFGAALAGATQAGAAGREAVRALGSATVDVSTAAGHGTLPTTTTSSGAAAVAVTQAHAIGREIVRAVGAVLLAVTGAAGHPASIDVPEPEPVARPRRIRRRAGRHSHVGPYGDARRPAVARPEGVAARPAIGRVVAPTGFGRVAVGGVAAVARVTDDTRGVTAEARLGTPTGAAGATVAVAGVDARTDSGLVAARGHQRTLAPRARGVGTAAAYGVATLGSVGLVHGGGDRMDRAWRTLQRQHAPEPLADDDLLVLMDCI